MNVDDAPGQRSIDHPNLQATTCECDQHEAFIFAIFAVFCVVVHGNAHLPDESATPTLTHRSQETCGNNADLVSLFEVHSPSITLHYYTISEANVTFYISPDVDSASFQGAAVLIFPFSETSTALASGWESWTTTGYNYPSQICGSVPLYRLHFVAANTDYMYTTSTTVRDNAVTNQGFTYEGITGYVMQLLTGVGC
ncbi:hypothetical protein MVEN_02154100 [Mycena venus]|uniref:DUF5648 domain-containing protein n=1 Tax=Mycena venus TaxID=2733690 RepID=A0A8H6XAN6_9AGAR|nr:hypothetical protein MVEN_02154100 [Mycena venus]